MRDGRSPGDDAIRSERDRFVAFAFAAADLLLEVDGDGRITFAAGALKSLTQRDAAALMGRPFGDLLAAADRSLIRVLLTSIKDGGRLSPMLVQLAPPLALNVMLGGCRLPTPHEAYQVTLTVVAARPTVAVNPGERDASTGLLAKDDFSRLAEDRLRSGGFRLSFVDVGGLESVRERADQELSEGFMAAVGRHLRAQSADGDSAGQIGDGRFGVIHQGGFDAENLHRQIADLAHSAQLGSSVTVAASTVDLSADALSETDAARTVLYAINSFSNAKRGEFTLTSLADGFRHLVRDTAARVRDLRSQVAAHNFSLVFQPIVALDTKDVHHYEALSRFAETADGGSNPARVIAFAEQLGVVAEIDLAVCERVIVLLESRRAEMRPSVAVNISGRSLESELFGHQLDELLRQHAGVTSDLLIEITESALIVRMTEVQNLIRMLQTRGVRICLDDFGAGAASFHYLNALPADFVKIDGRYVRNATANRRDRAFLKAIAKLCRELGTATVAEMVETEAQAATMADLGIGYGQGYLFGRPGPELPSRSGAVAAAPGALHRALSAREAARAAGAARTAATT